MNSRLPTCLRGLGGISLRSNLITDSDMEALGARSLLLRSWEGTTAILWGPVRLSTPLVDKVGPPALSSKAPFKTSIACYMLWYLSMRLTCTQTSEAISATATPDPLLIPQTMVSTLCSFRITELGRMQLLVAPASK